MDPRASRNCLNTDGQPQALDDSSLLACSCCTFTSSNGQQRTCMCVMHKQQLLNELGVEDMAWLEQWFTARHEYREKKNSGSAHDRDCGSKSTHNTHTNHNTQLNTKTPAALDDSSEDGNDDISHAGNQDIHVCM